MPKKKKTEVQYVDQGGFFCMKGFCTEIHASSINPRSDEAKKLEEVIKKALKDAGYDVQDVPAV